LYFQDLPDDGCENPPARNLSLSQKSIINERFITLFS